MNQQPPDVEDPRDDEEKLIDALKEIARGAATRTDTAPYEEYQPTPEKARDWEPHAWVVTALVAAYQAGENQGKREGHSVANQVEETFRGREQQLIMSCMLVFMEQCDIGRIEMDLDKVTTVHDRKQMRMTQLDNKVTFIMESPPQ